MNVATGFASRGAYDGIAAGALARELEVPAVVALDSAPSTLDVAHALAAEGAPSGTLVIADEQTAGRGRGGKRWASASGQGIWLTIIERELDPAALSVLALRLGIAAADALQPLVDEPIAVKWPNDLWLSGGKLAGILAEARWREGTPEWVAIGMGVNVRAPASVPDARGLRGDATRLAALARLAPALRAAVALRGPLGAEEIATLATRDLARGRSIVQPARGVAAGVDADGQLLVRGHDGLLTAHRSGSLVFAEAS